MFFRRQKPRLPTFEEQLEVARQQGFTIEGRRLQKYGCAAVLEPAGQAEARFVEPPGLLLDDEIARLEDRGYQKVVVTKARGARPALAEQLQTLHRFNAELRQIFRLPTLYNQSLGTVSDRYLYDRLHGR